MAFSLDFCVAMGNKMSISATDFVLYPVREHPRATYPWFFGQTRVWIL
jgi:hypothetical protein